MTSLSVSTRSVEGVLTLLQPPGVGPKTAATLAGEFLTLGAVYDGLSHDDLPGVSGKALIGMRDFVIWKQAIDRAHRIIEQAEQHRVRILTVFDEEFPPLLRSISDGPMVLYVKGALRVGLKNVACIGTREPSRFGTEVTRRLVSLLATQGWGIVSGLAKGIDAESHRAALDSHGYTVAILANGLDKVYPAENRQLADEIVDRGGAVISEQPFGVAAKPVNLVQRDRLQSGMSVATIVMQTDVIGGSMHTVRFTLSQGRMLVAPVPRGKHAEDMKSRGLLALTGNNGPSLADMLKVSGDYRDILLRRFSKCAPAFAVRGRTDYPDLLSRLAERLEFAENPANKRAAEMRWDFKSMQDRSNDLAGADSH